MSIEYLYGTAPLFSHLSDDGIPIFSSWGQNANGLCLLGTCISSVNKNQKEECTFLFILYDEQTGCVYEQRLILPYLFIYQIDIAYSTCDDSWIIAFTAHARNHHNARLKTYLDLYAFYGRLFQQTSHLRRIADTIIETETEVLEVVSYPKFVLSFSPSKNSLPLLCARYFEDLSQPYAFLMTPSIGHMERPINLVELTSGYTLIPYTFAHSLLVFTCSYTEGTTYTEKIEYSGLTGTWQLKIAAYEPDGLIMTEYAVPDVSCIGHHEDLFAFDDLNRWIWPTLCVTQGPYFLEKQRETCVAVLQLSEAIRDDRDLPSQERQKTRQGGLYCIDGHGHIVQYQHDQFGEKLSLCLSGAKIIGTDWWQGQWRLWSWLPLLGGDRTISHKWTSDADRVTLIATAMTQPKGNDFWCLEEYAAGIRFSRFSGEALESTKQVWMADKRLPYRMDRQSTCLVPCSVVALGERLLVAVINREQSLQIVSVA